MTLYWWMHWFWVTAQIAGCTVIGVSSPIPENLFEDVIVTTEEITTTKQQSFPIANGLDYLNSTNVTPLNKHVTPLLNGEINTIKLNNRSSNSMFENITQVHVESKANIEKSGSISKMYTNKKEIMKNISKPVRIKHEDYLTVMPLDREHINDKNRLNSINNSKILNDITNHSINQINNKYTEKLVVDSVSPPSTEESLRSNRARGTLFTVGLQRDQKNLEKHFSKLSNDESSVGIYSNNGTSPTDIAIIILSCLATVILISTAGSLGFIMYRRKYLNPPQTLNSDKCSNPDSSGYIDDSTIRDNSEEMYSLDNDSFLNSLEAMTIQNYWTDSVKHTKL